VPCAHLWYDHEHCLIRLTMKPSHSQLSIVNLPPGFSPTTQYYAVLKETLELSIDIVDPEGMPVTLSLMDGSPSKSVVRDNVLIWNATNDANTQFFLKAMDACQATSHLNITVSFLVCQCQNNGSCVPHPNKPRGSGFYECQCVPGYTGDKCETNIDECQYYPCSRGSDDGCLNWYIPNKRIVCFAHSDCLLQLRNVFVVTLPAYQSRTQNRILALYESRSF